LEAPQYEGLPCPEEIHLQTDSGTGCEEKSALLDPIISDEINSYKERITIASSTLFKDAEHTNIEQSEFSNKSKIKASEKNKATSPISVKPLADFTLIPFKSDSVSPTETSPSRGLQRSSSCFLNRQSKF
jgi:hypothetical protein